MAGHCIVCGMGDIGYRIVELLHRLGESVVVITDQVREERRQTAEALGVRVLLGDARNDRLLLEAGLASARVLIAATDKDLVNIEVALDARRLHPGLPVVVRLFDQTLARQLETSFEVRRALGMSTLAAPSFTAAALGEAILAGLTIHGSPYVVGRHRVEGGPLLGVTLGSIARRHGLLALARERPGEERVALPPKSEEVLEGDRLYLLGRKPDWDALFAASEPRLRTERKEPLWTRLAHALGRAVSVWREEPLVLRGVFLALCVLIPLSVALFWYYVKLSLADAVFYTVTTLHGEITLTDTGPEIKLYEILIMILGSITVATLYSMLTDYVVGSRLRKLLSGQRMPKHGHVAVLGMGHVGYRVVSELHALGVPVVAVDVDPNGPFLTGARSQASLVIGDARLDDTLLRAGLARAWAVVAATGDDSVNLGIGLAAKRINPKVRTVVRLFDAELARKVERSLGIDVALGASRIAAPTFASSALFPDVVKAFVIRDRMLVVLQRPAGPDWAGTKPSELQADQGIQILMRDGQLLAESVAVIDEKPLIEREEVLAVLWRKLAPPWSEQTAGR
ncbi:MAG TPA: NAD-binding protein [Thermoanaerobaculia bacterium]